MGFFLLLSFGAGVLTVLAPCVLPLLPVIVGESLSGKPSTKRAVVTILSLGASLFVFTFILKVSTTFAHIPLIVWSVLSGSLLIAFGIVSLFPSVWDRFSVAATLNRSAQKALGKGFMQQSLTGDILVGAALGPVFSSCSPTYFIILATVLPVSIAAGVLYLSLYIVGLCLALFAIALLGQRLVVKLGVASDPNGWFKRSIGALFILIGILVITGIDKKIEASLLSHAGVFDVTRIEQMILAKHSGTDMKSGMPTGLPATLLTPEQKALTLTKAPELVSPDAYLNTEGEPISINEFKGKKVVLIDFWTYSCINCQRTTPYLNKWYEKYKDQGLVIIGVHTPEFAFEHEQQNVARALKEFGISYPVVLDNEYKTWNAFDNQFWPRKYLIDIDGYVVYDHAGEGEYAETETAIQAALAERAARLGTTTAGIATSTVSLADPQLNQVGSPETYFGSSRNEYFGNGVPGMSGQFSYTFPQSLASNHYYLEGAWNTQSEYTTSASRAGIRYIYKAHDLYVVASSEVPVTVTIRKDGLPVGASAGKDVDPSTSTVTIGVNRLYHLVHDSKSGAHTIELQVAGPGLKVYTFTFG